MNLLEFFPQAAVSNSYNAYNDFAYMLIFVHSWQENLNFICFMIGDGLFNEDDDDDLFAPKQSETKEKGDIFSTEPPEVPEEPVKPKKPVGGVSMFGGFDPSALKKKQDKPSPKKGISYLSAVRS